MELNQDALCDPGIRPVNDSTFHTLMICLLRRISWYQVDNLPELILALRQCAKNYYRARESWELGQYRKSLDKQWLNSGD